MAMLLSSVVANAYDFEVDGIYYNIISASEITLEVTHGDNYYTGTVVIPSTVTYKSKKLTVTRIGKEAFDSCEELVSVEIPNSVTSIEKRAFTFCKSLTSITIPNSVTRIGSEAFAFCQSLTSITIPNSVMSIEAWAFDGCGLKDLYIENGTESLILEYSSEGPFYGCDELETLHLGRNLSYNYTGSSSEKYLKSPFCDNKALRTVTIGSCVTKIADKTFDGCTALKELLIEDGTTTLSLGYNQDEEGLFYDCPLENIYLGRNLSYKDSRGYGYSPFYNKNLKSLTIGNNVERIGKNAFKDCSLTSIYLLAQAPPSVGDGNFTGEQYLNVILYVPQGLLGTYQNADTWKNFWDIQEFNATRIDEVNTNDIAIAVTANGISLSDADGKAVAVYTVAGALVEKIDSYAGEEITLDKGVYIVRVGNNTLKVRL